MCVCVCVCVCVCTYVCRIVYYFVMDYSVTYLFRGVWERWVDFPWQIHHVFVFFFVRCQNISDFHHLCLYTVCSGGHWYSYTCPREKEGQKAKEELKV